MDKPQRRVDIQKIIADVIETEKPKTLSGDEYHQAIKQLRESLRTMTDSTMDKDNLMPWNILPDWSIVGMNHHHVLGQRRLFVSMQKDGVTITEEGNDDIYLWNRLWHKSLETNTYPKDKVDALIEIIKVFENNCSVDAAISSLQGDKNE